MYILTEKYITYLSLNGKCSEQCRVNMHIPTVSSIHSRYATVLHDIS